MKIPTETKNATLNLLSELISVHRESIISANKRDLGSADNLDPTLIDRLKVDDNKIRGMIAAIEEVIRLDDPQGSVLSSYTHPNGMLVENKVVPFGKILIIYESRPDVTIEAAISAFKAGNKILLKGGKEARNTNLKLVELWKKALSEHNLSEEMVTYLDINREETQLLLKENSHKVDLIIPRGGDGLINYIKANTDIPLLVSGRGNNFIYIHKDADFEMAMELVLNGKSRLSVCNAIDKVLFHSSIPDLRAKIKALLTPLKIMKMEVFGVGEFFKPMTEIRFNNSEDRWYEEFLSAKLLFGVVDSLDEAISKINKYSGGHSAVIVTENTLVAETFQEEVDCAAVYHNASSRFTDGGQFGFGAEIAISTQKLHFRGPLGLAQLVTNKWFISGNGQVRE
ncbi:MAG: glutamate-5-semialdehyde dehydrogenase [Balneola sp.]